MGRYVNLPLFHSMYLFENLLWLTNNTNNTLITTQTAHLVYPMVKKTDVVRSEKLEGGGG